MFGLKRLRRWLIDRHRMIYKFWDGSQYRRIDPVQAFLSLGSHDRFNPAVHCQLCDEMDREAVQITCGAVRDVFGVKDFDESARDGLTVGEQLGLLTDFYYWMDEQKKRAQSLQTSQSSTEESTSSESETPTTSSTSDSGSANTEPTCDEQMQSASP